MKALLFLMLVPVIIPSVAQTQEVFDGFVAQSPDLTAFYPLNPAVDTTLNGSFTYFYSAFNNITEAAIQLELIYKNGLLDGLVKVYTNDGNLYCEGNYADNKKSGEWKFYYPDGKIAEVGFYDPQIDSSFKKCDQLIEPFLTPSYFEYGVDTSTVEEILSANIIPLMNIGHNREDGRCGVWLFYNENGDLELEKNY